MFNGLITVRANSTRLPKKCLLNFGKFSVLGHVIERLKIYGINPVVCTSTNINDNEIIETAKNHKCKYFRGSEINKIKRWFDCAKFFNLDKFHTVDCDDPFFCGDEIKRSMNLLSEKNIDFVKPHNESSSGAAILGYSIKTSSLSKLNFIEDDNLDTEMIDPFLLNIENCNFDVLTNQIKIPRNIRLTLDYVEDYWLLRSLIRILGQNPSRKDIYQFFFKNPDFSKINFFKNKDWADKQASQIQNQLNLN